MKRNSPIILLLSVAPSAFGQTKHSNVEVIHDERHVSISNLKSNDPQKTYFKLKMAFHLGGTPSLLKSSMEEARLTRPESFFVRKSPYSYKYISYEVEWGKYIKENVSLAVLTGLHESGFARGYDNSSADVDFRFSNWILNPKMNFHSKTHTIGVGLTGLMVLYNDAELGMEYQHSKILPGSNISAETVSRKKKGFRMGVFTTLNLYPGFEIEPLLMDSHSQRKFQSKLNPSSLQLGFRFQF